MLVGAAHYEDGLCTAEELSVDAALDIHRQDAGFVWLSFVDPGAEELHALAGALGLHELACEDILSAHECPKFESYDDGMYLIVLRTARDEADERRARFGELAVFLGDSFVVTARKRGPHAQGSARATLLARSDLLACGISAVLWAILSKVVADIRPVVAALDRDLVELEAQVFCDDDTDPTRQIFDLR